MLSPASPPERKLARDRRSRRRRFGTKRVAAGAIAVVAAAVVAAALAMHSSPGQASPPQAMTAEQRALLAHQEESSRSEAATWVSHQVSRNAVVACDKQMCAALAADGFPSAYLRVLSRTSPYPLTADVIIETAAVRGFFSNSMSGKYAPSLLAFYGSGASLIDIRVIARQGATAYQKELTSDIAERKQVGSELLGTGQITALPQAAAQLNAGHVDTRLLYTFIDLAGSVQIKVVDFGNVVMGKPSLGTPLRYADLAETTVPGVHLSPAAYGALLVRFLRGLRAPYQPLRTETIRIGTTPVLRIEYGAPSPLDLFAPGSSGP